MVLVVVGGNKSYTMKACLCVVCVFVCIVLCFRRSLFFGITSERKENVARVYSDRFNSRSSEQPGDTV